MRALVTGGAGYIGSHLVDRLLGDGYEMSVLDNLSTGKIDNIAHAVNDIRFVNGSILDADLVTQEIERVDLVFHLAAAVGVRNVIERPLESLLINSQGTEHVLASCHRYWKRVVIASTSEVYGKGAKFPMSEDDDRVLGSTKINRWGYSTAKALDEHLAFAYRDLGLPVSIVRFFNSYGPRIDPRGYGSVVASFVGQALRGDQITVHGAGSQTRCFTYIDDSVQGTYLSGITEGALGSVVNLGNPTETSILELATEIRDLVGSSAEIVKLSYEEAYDAGFEDTKRRVPSVARAKEIMNWEPTVDLGEGLGRTLEWWKGNNYA